MSVLSPRPSRRVRRAAALLVAVAIGALVPAPAASAATTGSALHATPSGEEPPASEYWFGDVEVGTVVFGDSSMFTSMTIVNPDEKYPLPASSYAVGRLYDCDGKVAYTRYANTNTVRVGSGPWGANVSMGLEVPRRGGPFAKWVVTVASKGHEAERITITDGGVGFKLACDGSYRRNRHLEWWPQYDPKRPVNADFSVPFTKLVKNKIGTFGKVSGRAVVGGQVRVRGAHDTHGNPTCGFGIEIAWPQRPELESHAQGSECRYGREEIPRIAFFRERGVREVRAPSRGKQLSATVHFYKGGHDYTVVTPMGVIH